MSQYDNVKDIRQTPEIRPHSLTLRDLLSLSSLVSFETWPHYPWLGWNLTEFHWPLLLRLKVVWPHSAEWLLVYLVPALWLLDSTKDICDCPSTDSAQVGQADTWLWSCGAAGLSGR